MQTSAQWWAETKSDEVKLIAWLQKQYHGEITAADRIEDFCLSRAPANWVPSLKRIAREERTHAAWVGTLLAARGINPVRLNKPERYWDETLKGITDFETAAGVAAHAENMRLERIELIANDYTGPEDIRATFAKILRDEHGHANAFREMAGPDAIAKTLDAHLAGSAAIGLINVTEVL